MRGNDECVHRRYESPPRRTATQSRARPVSACSPAPAATMGGHSELDLKMEEEHKRERERENIMKQVRRLVQLDGGMRLVRAVVRVVLTRVAARVAGERPAPTCAAS